MVKTPTMTSRKNDTKDALIDFWLRRAVLHKFLGKNFYIKEHFFEGFSSEPAQLLNQIVR